MKIFDDRNGGFSSLESEFVNNTCSAKTNPMPIVLPPRNSNPTDTSSATGYVHSALFSTANGNKANKKNPNRAKLKINSPMLLGYSIHMKKTSTMIKKPKQSFNRKR